MVGNHSRYSPRSNTGASLFDIFITKCFYCESICNLADDNTLHSCAETLKEVIQILSMTSGNNPRLVLK